MRERAAMSQISFVDAEYAGKRKKMRREVFLDEMEVVVPWKALLGLIEPPYPVGDRGRRPYPPASMLRVHLMQNWFPLSDPAMGSGTAVPGLALRKANVCLDAGLFSDGRLPRAKAYF